MGLCARGVGLGHRGQSRQSGLGRRVLVTRLPGVREIRVASPESRWRQCNVRGNRARLQLHRRLCLLAEPGADLGCLYGRQLVAGKLILVQDRPL